MPDFCRAILYNGLDIQVLEQQSLRQEMAVIGVSLSLMATLYTSTGIAQTIMATTPVMILLPTFLFFHQKVTWREVFGAVISVCGVSLFFV